MGTKIKKGDEVKIIAGNEKGKKGIVISMTNNKVIVENINLRTKHIKPRQSDEKGHKKTIECPVHYSNIKLIASK